MGGDGVIEDLAAYRGYLRVLAGALVRDLGVVGAKVDVSGVVQGALIRAEEAREEFRGECEAEVRGWLRRILANRLADEVRRFTRLKRDAKLECRYLDTLTESAGRYGALVAGKDPTASQQVARREQVVRLATSLEKLPEAQRRAIELHHLAGHTVSETAELLDCTRASVAGLLRRALKSLREDLPTESGR